MVVAARAAQNVIEALAQATTAVARTEQTTVEVAARPSTASARVDQRVLEALLVPTIITPAPAAPSHYNKILLGAGDLYVGGTDVGATQGASEFALRQDIYFPTLANSLADVAGTGKVLKEVAALRATFAEVTLANLLLCLPTLVIGSDMSSEYTLLSAVGQVAVAEHRTVMWQGETLEGKHVQFWLYNALAIGGLKLALSYSGIAGYEVTFLSYVQGVAPRQRCWRIVMEI